MQTDHHIYHLAKTDHIILQFHYYSNAKSNNMPMLVPKVYMLITA